jgi:hypothetical protein
MDALIVLIAVVASLVLFDLDALRWSADSRDHLSATWRHNETTARGI